MVSDPLTQAHSSLVKTEQKTTNTPKQITYTFIPLNEGGDIITGFIIGYAS